MAKENNIPKGLYWQGKRTEIERISLPFKTIETFNESRAIREKEKEILMLKRGGHSDMPGGTGITVLYGLTTNTLRKPFLILKSKLHDL